jgi:phosphoserine phosphatase RsbU/P
VAGPATTIIDHSSSLLPAAHQRLAGGQPLLYDLATASDLDPLLEKLYAEGILFALSLPLLVQGKLIAILNLGRSHEGMFTAQEVAVGQGLANQLAVALQNANLVSRLEQRLVELSKLHQLGQRLLRIQAPVTLSQEIAAALGELFDYEYCAILLIEEPDRLVPFVRTAPGGLDKLSKELPEIRLGQGIVGWVAQHGQAVCLPRVADDPRYYQLHADVRSELCVPLRAGEITFGVINMETARPNAYGPDEQQLLETVAAQIAVAIQNARLLERERQSQEQLRNLTSYLQTAREAERAHIAREIHDEFGPGINRSQNGCGLAG